VYVCERERERERERNGKFAIIESLDFLIWGDFQICVFENLDQNVVLLLWYEIMVVDGRHAYESHQLAIIHNKT
jgi:hypothetical protein